MTQVPQPAATAAPRRSRLVMLLPLMLFLALAALFLIRLGAGDPSRIPSALIGHPAPLTVLPAVAGLERDGKPLPGLDPAQFLGNVSLVNVWASWCVPCHDEVPFLQQLARDPRIRLVGIDYKDHPDNARRFLNRYGNPFAASGADENGRAAIEWGVYGVPETFVVGRDGRIAFKLVGPITPDNFERVLLPELAKALGGE
jgi:cytochrome c biogenesis protein CcmG/thiol:disulfide interchange protein DsbE